MKTPDFQTIFQNLTGLNLLIDTDFIIVDATNAYLKATYTQRQEIVGKHIFEVFPDNPNDPNADGTKNLKASLQKVLSSKAVDAMPIQKYDIRVPGTEGKEFQVRYWSPVNSPILGENGNVVFIVHRVEDVTEFVKLQGQTLKMEVEIIQRTKELEIAYAKLHASNEEQEKFFSVSLDMLCISGFNGVFKRVNPAFESVLGFSKEELCTRPYLDFIHPDDITKTLEQITLQKQQGAMVFNFENRYLCKDGGYKLLSWKSVPIGDLMYAAARDITQQKQDEMEILNLNEKLKIQNTNLELANKELESFSHTISHDLRAPLRAMMGFSQILLEEASSKLTADESKNLKRIHDASQNMAHLIDGLLALSKLSREDIVFVSFNLSTLVNSIFDEFRRGDPKKRNINVKITENLQARGDIRLLRSALFNLIGNAWKFTSKNAISNIEFGVELKEGVNTYFIKDDGAGFDMQFANKLFSAFQRLHKSSEFEGTGIGLASVQKIILRHGGKIWAHSELGKGATFYFTL